MRLIIIRFQGRAPKPHTIHTLCREIDYVKRMDPVRLLLSTFADGTKFNDNFRRFLHDGVKC